MIIEVNPDLFNSTNQTELANLSELINLFIKRRFMWEVSSLTELIYEEGDEILLVDNNFTQSYLSDYARASFKEEIECIILLSAYITETHRKYLCNIIVGNNSGEISIENALRIINQPSKVIVENGHNDWKCIKGLAKKYSNHKTRKSIYKLLSEGIENNTIIEENAGGKGQIITRLNDLSNGIYNGIIKYKIAAIFDSDRDSNNQVKDEQKAIISHIKNGKQINSTEDVLVEESDLILWHVLYKRESENYLHPEVIFNNLTLTENEISEIQKLSVEQYDFADFEEILKGNRGINVKKDFPELYLANWTKDKIEARCNHHQVTIPLPNGTSELASEIEELLLKLAAII